MVDFSKSRGLNEPDLIDIGFKSSRAMLSKASGKLSALDGNSLMFHGTFELPNNIIQAEILIDTGVSNTYMSPGHRQPSLEHGSCSDPILLCGSF